MDVVGASGRCSFLVLFRLAVVKTKCRDIAIVRARALLASQYARRQLNHSKRAVIQAWRMRSLAAQKAREEVTKL